MSAIKAAKGFASEVPPRGTSVETCPGPGRFQNFRAGTIKNPANKLTAGCLLGAATDKSPLGGENSGRPRGWIRAALVMIAAALSLSACGLADRLSGDYYLQVYNSSTREFEGKSEYVKFTGTGFYIHTDDKYGFVNVPGTYVKTDSIVQFTFTEPDPAGFTQKDGSPDDEKYKTALQAKADFEALGDARWTFSAQRLGTILLNESAGLRYKSSPMFDALLIFERIPPILAYLPITLYIATVSMFASLLVAFIVAIVKVKRVPVARHIASAYVSFTRGTPIVIQLYATLYGIPMALKALGADTAFINEIPRITFALVALALNDAAYSSEAIRAAIQAVDKGQIEAAHSIGMSTWQTLRRIIIPESLVIALPSLGNAYISMIKGTSLAFTVSVVEMTRKGQLLSQMDYRYFEMYVTLAIIYWMITFVVSKLLNMWERHLKCNERAPKGGEASASAIGSAKMV
ncbi:MAG: amino acid ABC transporter permease [Clostridiales bacterium]|jgi:polar amino acid transport system permease protein|nr:amino acid ABC transporter permease [Clostridiales bacterium]